MFNSRIFRDATRRARRRLPVAMVVVAVAVGAVVIAFREEGFAARAVELGAGSVWVSSTGPGQLALLDGASGRVTAQLQVAASGDDLIAVQGELAGYAVNRTTGSVTRADAATWATTATTPLPNSTRGLSAVVGGSALYITDIEHGLVVVADPKTLVPQNGQQSLLAARGTISPAVDRLGTLWILDSLTGDLIRMTGSPEHTELAVAGGASSALVLADGTPVVLNLTNRRAIAIDPGSGEQSGETACIDADAADSTIRFAGSNSARSIYIVSGRDGVLRVTDLSADTCNRAITIAAPGSNLGEPVEVSGHLFIPDQTTGKVVVVDPVTESVIATEPVVSPGSAFELIGRDGFAFYNDRASDQAGVVNTDGTSRKIAKYDSVDPGKGVHVGGGEEQGTQPQDLSLVEDSANLQTTSTSEEDALADPASSPTGQTPVINTIPTPPSSGPPTTATSTPQSGPLTTAEPSISSTTAPPTSETGQSSTTTVTPNRVEITIDIQGDGVVAITAPVMQCRETCRVLVDVGSELTLTATPDTNRQLSTWSEPCVVGQVTCGFTVTTAVTINAEFGSRPEQTLKMSIVGEGSIKVGNTEVCTAAQQSCSQALPFGFLVGLTAAAADGWAFGGWSESCSGEGPCNVTLSETKSVTATFRMTGKLTATAGEGGLIFVGDQKCEPTCVLDFPGGTDVGLTVLPDEDHTFNRWSDRTCFRNPACSIRVDGDTSISADFLLDPISRYAGAWIENDGQGNDRLEILKTGQSSGLLVYHRGSESDGCRVTCDPTTRTVSATATELTANWQEGAFHAMTLTGTRADDNLVLVAKLQLQKSDSTATITFARE